MVDRDAQVLQLQLIGNDTQEPRITHAAMQRNGEPPDLLSRCLCSVRTNICNVDARMLPR